MKRIAYLLSLTLCLLACKKQPQQHTQTPVKQGEYQLVWSQEFEDGVLDPAVWNIDDNARGGGNAEMQYYTPKNVSVGQHPVTGEGCLILTTQREDYKNRPATSARLNTQDKFMFQYGRIEARICFPYTANGLWPAFWMLGNNLIPDLGDDDSCEQNIPEGRVVWPKCGEIDICEMGHFDGIQNGTQDRYFNGACHWGESFNNGMYPNCAGVKTADYALQGEFHTWTVDWTEDSIAMYLDLDQYPDAEPYFALSLKGKEVNQPGHYFNHPFYFVLNLSVGGFFPGLPSLNADGTEVEKYPALITANDSNFQQITALPTDGTPVNMYVDYIRVYQK